MELFFQLLEDLRIIFWIAFVVEFLLPVDFLDVSKTGGISVVFVAFSKPAVNLVLAESVLVADFDLCVHVWIIMKLIKEFDFFY